MLPVVESLGQRTQALVRDGLAAMLVLALCCGPALAGDPAPSPEDRARSLADEALRRTGEDGDGSLGAWTRGVIGRALERAGETARRTVPGTSGPSAAPLAAERHAVATGTGLSVRPNSGEVIVFLSLSVPPASWRQWADDAARADVPLVLRGVGEGGFRATVTEIGKRLGGHDAGSLPRARSGVAIDPRLFRLFGVTRVPAACRRVRAVAAPGTRRRTMT